MNNSHFESIKQQEIKVHVKIKREIILWLLKPSIFMMVAGLCTYLLLWSKKYCIYPRSHSDYGHIVVQT